MFPVNSLAYRRIMNDKTPELKQLKVYTPTEQKRKLEVFASIHSTSVNALVNGLIDAYIDRQSELVVLELHRRGALVAQDVAYA